MEIHVQINTYKVVLAIHHLSEKLTSQGCCGDKNVCVCVCLGGTRYPTLTSLKEGWEENIEHFVQYGDTSV